MRTVAITGASGFIGSALSRRLIADGHKVYGIGRTASYKNGIIPVVCDFKDYATLKINDRIDEIYHFAWQGTNSKEYGNFTTQFANVQAAFDIAQFAIHHEIPHFFAINSNYAYSTPPSMYSIAKIAATEIIQITLKDACTTLIIPNTYGENDKTNTAVVFFIKQLLNNEPLNLIEGNAAEDWVYIEDLIENILLARKPKTYYLGTPNPTTFREKLLQMCETLNSSSKLNFGAFPQTSTIDYSKLPNPSVSNQTPFPETILKTAKWIKGGHI